MTHVVVALFAVAGGFVMPLALFPWVCLALIVVMIAIGWANMLTDLRRW